MSMQLVSMRATVGNANSQYLHVYIYHVGMHIAMCLGIL